MKINKDMANLENSETIAEIPLACCDELAAVEFLEKRLWKGEPKCAHCDSTNVYQMKDASGQRNKRFLWRCHDCKDSNGNKTQFTVRIGTVFEESRIPLRHWCYVHSKWMNPNPLELKLSWANFQLFIERLWTSKNNAGQP